MLYNGFAFVKKTKVGISLLKRSLGASRRLMYGFFVD